MMNENHLYHNPWLVELYEGLLNLEKEVAFLTLRPGLDDTAII